MGGSAKSAGAGSSSYDRYAVIAGAVCVGPVKALLAIVIDDKQVWPGVNEPTGGLVRTAANENGIEFTVTGWGRIMWYWGTATQPRDPTLNKASIVDTELHPAYPGVCYAVLGGGANSAGFLFGRERESAPNVQFVVEREPQVTNSRYLVTQTAGVRLLASQGLLLVDSLTGGGNDSGQANPASVLLELYQNSNPNPSWPGWAPEPWSAAAALMRKMPEKLYLSPLIDSGVALSEAAMTIGLHADLHVTVDAATGALVPAYRQHDGSPVSPVMQVDGDDFSEPARFATERVPGDVTGFAATFFDRDRNYKESAVTVDDAAALALAGETRRESLRRPFITRRNQLTWHVTEWFRTQTGDVLSVQVKILSWTAAPLRPGQWITIDISWDPAAGSLLRDFWITEVSRPYEGPVTIKAVSDGSRTSTPGSSVLDPVGNETIPPPSPITNCFLFELPAGLADNQITRLLALANRPNERTTGMQCWYSHLADSVEPTLIGSPRFFPLWATLSGDLSATADTWAVSTTSRSVNSAPSDEPLVAPPPPPGGTLPPLTASHPLRITVTKGKPDSLWLDEATGIDAANNNQLLLYVCTPRGAAQTAEIFSVGQMTIVGGGTGTTIYAVRALRGRFTTPLAFTGGAEVYLFPRRHIVPLYHTDFPNLRSGATTSGILRLLAYTPYAIREYTTGEDVQVPVTLNAVSPSAPKVTWSAPAWPANGNPLIVTPSATPVPLVARVDDVDANLVSVVVNLTRPDATEVSLLNVALPPKGTFAIQTSAVFDTPGRWVVKVIATDEGGLSITSINPVDAGTGTSASPSPPTFYIHTDGIGILMRCSTPNATIYFYGDYTFAAAPPALSAFKQWGGTPIYADDPRRAYRLWAYSTAPGYTQPSAFSKVDWA